MRDAYNQKLAVFDLQHLPHRRSSALQMTTNWLSKFERVLRPVRQFYWRLQRPTTLGVRAVVTNDSGAVLLVKHSYAPGWYLPGGGVERGETALGAVVRELAEEGGVEAIAAPVMLALYANHAVFPNDHVALYRIETWRLFFFNATATTEIYTLSLLDALPDGVTPGTRRRIAELFHGAPIAADW